MEINATGFSARELAPNRANIDQELAQKAQQKDEETKEPQKALEPRPVEQASSDKQGRIDLYA